jgi:hypothetical protein
MLTFPVSFSSPIVISVSILTAIGAYVLFGPEPNDRRRRGLFDFVQEDKLMKVCFFLFI